MADEKHIKLLKSDVKAWNNWRAKNLNETPDLREADLAQADLRWANLDGTDVRKADLSRAIIHEADLSRAKLSRADLSGANLSGAILSQAYLHDADLSGANLRAAYLREANLRGANLRGADLSWAILDSNDLENADFTDAYWGGSVLSSVDLSMAKGLVTGKHNSPSTIGMNTFLKSKGKIPAEFLRQCGLQPWEIEFSRLYDSALTPGEIGEILSTTLFQTRTHGSLYLGGIFISYSHDDSKFVNKIYEQLREAGAVVWLDRHDLKAGDVQKQIAKTIRIQDVVLIVLSENSVKSDWVETELEIARKKEKDEDRDVLCPVALDDAWKNKMDDVLWRQLNKKFVIDFSAWKTRKFNTQFDKLLSGIKKNYKIFKP
ncbi:MAG: toll/interleukin-1 receptor domain-containing protein [Deltaproteobacteria bacterium]|nr:toll/interleukin-1 receptor domain-containing protein [Deltaproteobacteria bacterium]